MKPRSAYRLPPACLLLGLFAASTLSAQTAPASASTPAPAVAPAKASPTTAVASAPPEEKPIELSPFTVTSDDDQGYRAQNTLAGSRLNSALKDTPGVLDVLTKEFLDDIGATTLEQALAFSANFAEDAGDFDSQGVINTVFPGSQQNASFRTRGLGGTVARNYLETDFRPSFYTIERIDNSSGPNSILFGLGSAGGVANVTSKQAKLNRNAYGLEFLTDRYGSRRATLDANFALIPKTLGLRLNAITNRGEKYRANFEDNTNGFQLAGTWRAGSRTEIRVEYERERTTGTVAYPGPHLDQVTNWITLGSRVATLPTNWETLSDANRRLVATPLSLTTNTATIAPVVVQNADRAYILNQATALSTNANNSNLTTSGTGGQSVDARIYNPRGNINGPGGTKGINRQIAAVAIDHKLRDNLYLNFSAAKESGEADTYQAFANGAASGALLQVDANATIPNAAQITPLAGAALTTNSSGQVVNPYAGQFYTQSRWLHRTQENEREIVQGTVAWQFNFGRWLGSHRTMASTTYGERLNGSENFRDSWLGSPFNASPTGTPNGVTRRRYANPNDAGRFHVPDWRDFPSLTWNHPTLGPLKTGWISENPNRRTARQFSYLTAAQSYFFERRLVTTVGYRVDEISNYVYNTSAGLIDRSKVAKTSTSGATRTFGGVFHVTRWASVYANSSSNFGPPRGTTVGPDAVVGPDTNGEGLDTGLKFELFDNKISLDLGYFDTTNQDVTEVLNLNLRTADSIAGAYNGVFSVLAAPAGTARLFNPNDAAAVAALRAAYSDLRPTFNATGDLLDQASRGYEVRLTANPFRGMRIRGTYSKTERERENLYRFTFVAAAQLRAYVADLQRKNPGLNVGTLTTVADPLTSIAQHLDNFDTRIDNGVDQNSSNFGAGKESFNFVFSYDFQTILKGLGTTLTASFKSGGYTGVYEERVGGVRAGALLRSEPIFGESTSNYGLALRYRTKLAWLRRTNVTFQLNITNLLDESDPIVRRTQTITIAPGAPPPTPAQIIPSSYFISNPRSWTLTARFAF